MAKLRQTNADAPPRAASRPTTMVPASNSTATRGELFRGRRLRSSRRSAAWLRRPSYSRQYRCGGRRSRWAMTDIASSSFPVAHLADEKAKLGDGEAFMVEGQRNVGPRRRDVHVDCTHSSVHGRCECVDESRASIHGWGRQRLPDVSERPWTLRLRRRTACKCPWITSSQVSKRKGVSMDVAIGGTNRVQVSMDRVIRYFRT